MDVFVNVLIPPKGDSDTTNRDRPRRPGEPETEQPGKEGGGGGEGWEEVSKRLSKRLCV